MLGFGQSVINSFAKAGGKVVEGLGNKVDEVSKAFDQSPAQGAVALLEFGPGSAAAEAFSALGIVPDDPVAKNIVSAAVNFATPMAFLSGVKDLVDIKSALAAKNAKKPAKAHTPKTPAQQFERVSNGRRPPGYAEGGANPTGLRPGVETRVWLTEGPQRPFVRGPAQQVEGQLTNICVQEGCVPNGKPIKDIPDSQLTPRDILNDPTLSFEDKIALFMFAVVGELQKEVAAKLEEFEREYGTGLPSGAPGAGGAGGGGTGGGGGAGGVAGGGGSPGLTANPGLTGNPGAPGPMAPPAGAPAGGAPNFDPAAFTALFAGSGKTPGKGEVAFGLIDIGGQAMRGDFVGVGKSVLLGAPLSSKEITIAQGVFNMAAPIVLPIVTQVVGALPPPGPVIAPFIPILAPLAVNTGGDLMKMAADNVQGGWKGIIDGQPESEPGPSRSEKKEKKEKKERQESAPAPSVSHRSNPASSTAGSASSASAATATSSSAAATPAEAAGSSAALVSALSTAVQSQGPALAEKMTANGGTTAFASGAPVPARSASAPKGTAGMSETEKEQSRTLAFERIKMLMSKLTEMQQSLSNILNTMHQGAMNTIRNIK